MNGDGWVTPERGVRPLRHRVVDNPVPAVDLATGTVAYVRHPRRSNMASIGDVAQLAGVSASTVSYVLSGKRPISAETRRRVLEAIESLDYHPHAGARALASSQTSVIALVMPLHDGLYLPVMMNIVTSVVTTARTVDRDVLLLTQDEGEQGLCRIAGSAMADAIIVMDVELHDGRLPRLRSLGLPAVLIGFPADPSGLVCLDLDFDAAASAAVEHMAALGHRRIALIGSPPEVYRRELGFAMRLADGFTTALRAGALHGEVHPCVPTAEATLALLTDLLGAPDAPTGLIVHNESAVPAVLDGLRALGRRVPQDVSVVAICPADVAESATPLLTSVDIPAAALGGRAVELVADLLAGLQVPAATMLPPRLVVRESTAAAADRTS